MLFFHPMQHLKHRSSTAAKALVSNTNRACAIPHPFTDNTPSHLIFTFQGALGHHSLVGLRVRSFFANSEPYFTHMTGSRLRPVVYPTTTATYRCFASSLLNFTFPVCFCCLCDRVFLWQQNTHSPKSPFRVMVQDKTRRIIVAADRTEQRSFDGPAHVETGISAVLVRMDEKRFRQTVNRMCDLRLRHP